MKVRGTLKKNSDFRRLYAKGKSAVTPYLVVYTRPNRLGENRLGYTVSVKLGHAVVRNRVRRRLREIYRLNLNGMEPGYDVILVARVRALLRRTYGAYGQQKERAPETVIRAGTLELDLDRHILRRKEEGDGWKPIELTPIEFNLLEVLMKSPGHVYNRLQLMENSHGFAFDGYERTIDAHIRNLRRKIEPDTKNPRYILTVYGIGYKFGG